MSDPYGAMLLDAVEGRDFGQEIIERDDGFFDTSTIDYYLAPFRRWNAVERRARRSATSVAACWTLAAALDEWRWNFKHAVERWLRSILLPERWRSPVGTVLMYGNNFGLLGSRSKARRLLRRLRPLADRIVAGSTDLSRTEDPVHLAYERRNRRRGRMPRQRRLRVRYRNLVSP